MYINLIIRIIIINIWKKKAIVKNICVSCEKETVNKKKCEICLILENQKDRDFVKGDLKIENGIKKKYNGSRRKKCA